MPSPPPAETPGPGQDLGQIEKYLLLRIQSHMLAVLAYLRNN